MTLNVFPSLTYFHSLKLILLILFYLFSSFYLISFLVIWFHLEYHTWNNLIFPSKVNLRHFISSFMFKVLFLAFKCFLSHPWSAFPIINTSSFFHLKFSWDFLLFLAFYFFLSFLFRFVCPCFSPLYLLSCYVNEDIRLHLIESQITLALYLLHQFAISRHHHDCYSPFASFLFYEER